MQSPKTTRGSKRQYAASVGIVILIAAACYPVTNVLGYRTVSLVLLLTVSVLAMRMSLGPVLLAAVLSAFIWDFFFIPPHLTLTVTNAEDALMLLMYFVIAILNGVLAHQIRRFEKLARRKENREVTLQLYTTLFNSISHELRTPVSTIWAASENLLASGQSWSATDRRQMAEEIHTAAERLNRLIDNLLNMSRLESGHIVLHWTWCDVGELLDMAVGRLQDDLQGRRVLISVPETLPLMRMDFSIMEQVIFNILHNAATYTPNGTTIRIEADYVDQHLVMTISDDGPGFKKDELEQVFEKFFRAKGAQAGGTGLGLSIVRGFVEAHRGVVGVGNRPEGGAVFMLKIPTGQMPKTVQPA